MFILLPRVYVLGQISFLSFLAAFHSIWIWVLITSVISLIQQKFVCEKRSLIVFLLGATILLLIVVADPGGYLDVLLD